MVDTTNRTLEEFIERRRDDGMDELADALEHLLHHEQDWDGVAASLEYLLDNQDEYENGEIDVGDLPLDLRGEVLLRVGVLFGTKWEEHDETDEQ